jgi:hypothetical protein
LEFQNAIKKIKEEKESEKHKLEKELDNSHKSLKRKKTNWKKEKNILKQARDKKMIINSNQIT